MKIDSGLVEVNGARLAYDDAGAGPAVALIHAGIADRRMWDAQLASFAERRRVIRYDLRGFGDSTLPPSPYAHYDDLRGLLAALRIARAALVGVSIGARVALRTALVDPDLVSALVLCTSRSGVDVPSDAVQQLWADVDAAAKAGDFELANEIELRAWVDGPHRTPEQVDAAVRQQVRLMNDALLRRAVAETDGGPELDFDPPERVRLGEVRAPTLLITGDLDVDEVIASMRTLAADIPSAESITIAGTGHMPSMERPAEFNSVVLDFLDRHGA